MTHLFLALSIVSFADDTQREKAIAAIRATGATIHATREGSIHQITAMPSKNRNVTFSDREMKLLKHFPELKILLLSGSLVSEDGLKRN